MNKSNRILIGAIFILVVALVSFNYSITGNIIKDKTVVSISPEVINSGQKIYITVNPGPKGVYKKACLYHASNNLRKTCTYRVCGGTYKCLDTSTFSFGTHSLESGIYYVKLFDYNINDYVKAHFTIT